VSVFHSTELQTSPVLLKENQTPGEGRDRNLSLLLSLVDRHTNSPSLTLSTQSMPDLGREQMHVETFVSNVCLCVRPFFPFSL